MRRLLAIGVLAAVVLGTTGVLATAPALANNDPHRVFLPSDPFDLPAGFCDFPVHFDIVANNEYGRFTTLPDGTTILFESGSFKVLATNLDSSQSILLNASGPGTLTFSSDGSFTIDGTGHWLVLNTQADAAQFGLPAVMLTSGQVHETFDGSGTLTELSVTGKVTDVCAELA